jgi:hypothetical protein
MAQGRKLIPVDRDGRVYATLKVDVYFTPAQQSAATANGVFKPEQDNFCGTYLSEVLDMFGNLEEE